MNSPYEQQQNAVNQWQLVETVTPASTLLKQGKGPLGPLSIMTIRLRLTLWYTALLGATLILFSVLVYSFIAANLWVRVQDDAARQALIVSKTVTSQLQRDVFVLPLNPFSAQIGELDFYASGIGVQMIALNGEIVDQSQNLKRTSMSVPNYQASLANIRQGQNHRYYTTFLNAPVLVYSAPIWKFDKIVGAVQIVQPVAPVENTLSEIARYLILGTALSLLLAALVGAYLARRALAPIGTITQTASNISRTKDLGQRLTIPNDASEVGQLAATFNNMLDRIQTLFKTQERLIADVSHELRTPLTTVQGNIQLLRRMAVTVPATAGQPALGDDMLQEVLSEVESEATRMSKMISDLLLLAQADSGALRLQMGTVEMDTLLLEVYRQAKRVAELRKNAEPLEIRLGSEDQAIVWGDRERLRQLLLNLADNAIKYTPTGVITLSLENTEGWVKVSISDTGIGIHPDNQKDIFNRFYRTDKARSRELGGSGLGLSIVQWIAQAHQAYVTVESKPQEGSTFTLWLPAFSQELESANKVAKPKLNGVSPSIPQL
ncbi:MAG: HAMP domain-containing sensor histidine kinase [Chloroflexi bacterium]|nr:HAMP domain-containing sensor histidine kinase [Chloroflexota bacterium]